ncbi:hypothetical protein BIW11_05187 [Tropilaelaps mercedesae]|uniref:Uncharacterized protein n=1 Tax=Tropilaelaps mercedesae TaxID=418985 RepID=A0A1V9Y3D4_9ACAR|nr:hypothetical protein BIW11_05187 [Tropilaelaps mercedesae]
MRLITAAFSCLTLFVVAASQGVGLDSQINGTDFYIDEVNHNTGALALILEPIGNGTRRAFDVALRRFPSVNEFGAAMMTMALSFLLDIVGFSIFPSYDSYQPFTRAAVAYMAVVTFNLLFRPDPVTG